MPSRDKMQARSIRATMLDAVAVRAGMGVTRISLHRLRRVFATALVEGGCSLNEVRDLPHESIATTQSYALTSRKHIQEAAARLPDVLGTGLLDRLAQVGLPMAASRL